MLAITIETASQGKLYFCGNLLHTNITIVVIIFIINVIFFVTI